MAGEEYCISAGAFARMCQTTRDTLRYYEKQGILVPKKSEKNGYHYYSYAQISSYYFISTFRGLGCSNILKWPWTLWVAKKCVLTVLLTGSTRRF